MSHVEGLPESQRRWAMFCVLLALTLSSLDSAIANIALPSIVHALSTSDAAAVWVVNGYQISVTVCLLPAAALCDTLGLKRVYATGLTIFTVASLACALSPTLVALVTARLAQGAGGACMSVAGMALVRTIYPRSIVSRGFALVALAVATSGALGPTVAALILSVANWPWLFLVNVPFGLFAVPLSLAVTPADVRIVRRFDWIGALLNALALGFIVVGIHELGVGGPSVAVEEMVGGLVCFALLVRQQSRQDAPMLPLDLLRMPVFSLSMGASVCAYASQILAYVSVPFLFQTTLHMSPVETGLLVTPWPVMVAIAAPLAGRLATRYPASVTCSCGLVTLAIGLVLMSILPAVPSNLDIVWRMAICGIGFGLFQTPNNTAMMTTGPVARSGAASGMNAVARFLGMSLGSAVVALIFGLGGAHATIACLETGAGFAVVGAISSGARRYS